MKVKEIHLVGFRRFTDLKIQEIPKTVKLVVLLGPNGCGKSSLFDAMLVARDTGMGNCTAEYHLKASQTGNFSFQGTLVPFHDSNVMGLGDLDKSFQVARISFHDSGVMPEKSIYVRTAYRNDPVVSVKQLAGLESVLCEKGRFSKMIENDAAATSNYHRLAGLLLQQAFNPEDRGKTLGQFQDEALGEIQGAMKRLFPDLILNSLGNPLANKTFTFDKGESKNFPYMNLSGGEKAAFDLLLDIFVKRGEYDNTVFCIDEPEAHMNSRLQGELLQELCVLINDKSQLWIATHSIGMMRKALELHKAKPDTVAFLDFGQGEFDKQQVIEPAIPDRKFWEKTHEVALDDLGALVVPNRIIICEGRHGDKGFDAECYNSIFSDKFPDTKFISAGGKDALENFIPVVSAVAKGVAVFGLRDRDDSTDEGIDRKEKEGIKVLRKGAIEDYFLSDDVLSALCQELDPGNCQDKTDTLIRLRDNSLRDKQGDRNAKAKATAKAIHQEVKKWAKQRVGDDYTEFFREIVAPLIKPGMSTYEKLKTIIFGDNDATSP